MSNWKTMALLKKICDLDYRVLKCFFENLLLLHIFDSSKKHQLAFLHKQLGLLKSELLCMHPEYIDVQDFNYYLQVYETYISLDLFLLILY